MIAGLTNRPELTKSPSRGNEEAFRFRVDSCICLCKFRYESARRKSFEVIAAAAEGGLIQRDSARLFCPCIIFSAAACRIQMQKITWCLVPCRPAEPFFRFATSVNFHPGDLLTFHIHIFLSCNSLRTFQCLIIASSRLHGKLYSNFTANSSLQRPERTALCSRQPRRQILPPSSSPRRSRFDALDLAWLLVLQRARARISSFFSPANGAVRTLAFISVHFLSSHTNSLSRPLDCTLQPNRAVEAKKKFSDLRNDLCFRKEQSDRRGLGLHILAL